MSYSCLLLLRMAFNTRQTTILYFLAVAISLVHIQSANSENINSSPSERVKRRSYYNPWSTTANRRNAVSLYDAARVYRPPTYTISRPYYIPVYGTQGRPMLFYPPQPLYVNPGVPQDNPIYPPFRGPTYLPPKESPHLPDESKTPPPKEAPITTTSTTKAPITTAQAPVTMTTPKTVNRLGEEDDDMQDFDDPNAPVWGGGNGGMMGAASGAMAGSSNGGKGGAANGGMAMAGASNGGMVMAGTSNGGMTGMALSGDQNKESGPVPTRAPMTRPTTPPLVHNAEASAEFIIQPPQPLIPAQRPRPRTTTPSPAALGPSNCVWAIISCCSAGNPSILPQNCFEQRGCPGPFWGTSPCESEYARAAIAAAVNYYNSPRNNLGK